MVMDDNDGQMIFGEFGGLKLPDICLTGDRTRARCVTGAHATTWPTAVDSILHSQTHSLTHIHTQTCINNMRLLENVPF